MKCSSARELKSTRPHSSIQLSVARAKDNDNESGGEYTSAVERTAQLELLVAQLLVVVFELLVLLADLRRERLLLLRRRASFLRRGLVRSRSRHRSLRELVVRLELLELKHNQSVRLEICEFYNFTLE